MLQFQCFNMLLKDVVLFLIGFILISFCDFVMAQGNKPGEGDYLFVYLAAMTLVYLDYARLCPLN